MTYGTNWGNGLLSTIRATPSGVARSLWLALHKADPTSSGIASTELSGGSYQRQRVYFSVPSAKTMVNSAPVQWLSLRANTITHIALWDAHAGGNIIAYGAITPQKIEHGQSKTILIGNFAVSI